MIKQHIGQHMDAAVHRLFPFLFWRRLDANLLTVCGVLVSSLAATAYAGGEIFLGGLLVFAGGFFDLVDGVVARHQGTVSRFGAFLDSTLDRLVDIILLLGVLLYYSAAGNMVSVLVSGWALAASVLVSYAKARAELEVPDFDAGFFERGERIGFLAWGSVLGFFDIAIWIIAVGSTLTVIQRFALAHREMARLAEADRTTLGGSET